MQPAVKQPAELRPREGRPPPLDLDAEAAVLSTVLLVPAAFDEVAGVLQAHMFYSEANKRIFEAATSLRQAESAIDFVTVAAWLNREGKLAVVGGTPYLTMLTDETPFVNNVLHHAEIVRDRWQLRRLIVECQNYAALAYTSSEPAITIVQAAEGAIAELSVHGAGKDLEHVGTIIESEVEVLATIQTDGVRNHGTGIPTGFENLDGLMGGLHRGDLYIVAGRPGMGKSSLARNVAVNVARPRRHAVAFFTLEMPKSQVAIGFACSERDVRMANVRKNALGPDEWENFKLGARELASYPIWIDDTPALSLFDIRARVRKLQRDIAAKRTPVECEELGLVVVDYLQLMRGVRSYNDNRENEVSSLSRGLKELAKNFNVPVMALSQLNRSVETKPKKDRRPQLSDLRESGAIEQDADAVGFVYRPEYYDKEARKGDAEFIIAKQRNGPPGTVTMHFKGDSMRFYERAHETLEELESDFIEDR